MNAEQFKRLQLMQQLHQVQHGGGGNVQQNMQATNDLSMNPQLLQQYLQQQQQQNPQFLASTNFRSTPTNINPRLTTPPLSTAQPMTMFNQVGTTSPATIQQTPQQPQQQFMNMQAFLQHRQQQQLQQQQQQQQQNDGMFVQNQFYGNPVISGISAQPVNTSGRMSATETSPMQFIQTPPNTTSPTMFLNNPTTAASVNTHIPITIPQQQQSQQLHQHILNQQQPPQKISTTPVPVSTIPTQQPQHTQMINPNTAAQQPASAQQQQMSRNQQQMLILQERHKAFSADYQTPFRSKKDIMMRLTPFRFLSSNLKQDAKWEEKIDNVSKKFLRSRSVAEGYVQRTLTQEANKMLTTEEELLMEILSFRAEQSAWKVEKKQLEIERAKQLEAQRLSQLNQMNKMNQINRVNQMSPAVNQYYAPVAEEDDFIKDSDADLVTSNSQALDVMDQIDLEDISLLDKIGVVNSDNLIQQKAQPLNGNLGTPTTATGPDYSDFMNDNFMDMPPTPADMNATDEYFNFDM